MYIGKQSTLYTTPATWYRSQEVVSCNANLQSVEVSRTAPDYVAKVVTKRNQLYVVNITKDFTGGEADKLIVEALLNKDLLQIITNDYKLSNVIITRVSVSVRRKEVLSLEITALCQIDNNYTAVGSYTDDLSTRIAHTDVQIDTNSFNTLDMNITLESNAFFVLNPDGEPLNVGGGTVSAKAQQSIYVLAQDSDLLQAQVATKRNAGFIINTVGGYQWYLNCLNADVSFNEPIVMPVGQDRIRQLVFINGTPEINIL